MSVAPCLAADPFFRAPQGAVIGALLARLGLALVLGLAVGLLHALQRGRRGGTPMAGSLAVLSPLIALVVWAIGGDVARAFGLVGILAIVRFRTIVRDPSDAVYVLFAVAVGVTTAAAESWVMPVVGCAALGAALVLVGLVVPGSGLAESPRRLVVRLAASALPALEERLRQAALTTCRSVGLRSLKGGGVVEARYEVAAADPADVDRLVLVLAQTDGVHTAASFRPRG